MIRQTMARIAQGVWRELSGQAEREVDDAALVLEEEIKETLSHPGSGIVYKSRGIRSSLARKGTKRRAKQEHRASAPGEPPAPDIGELRQTIGRQRVGRAVLVGSPLPQAVPLNFGNLQSGGSLKPRPFMERSLAAAIPRMSRAMQRAMRRRVDEVGVPGF